MSENKRAVKKLDFEKSLARLETVVREMEEGVLPLETMMSRFEEGMGLIAACSKTLQEVERKVEILIRENETLLRKPFEAAPDPGEG